MISFGFTSWLVLPHDVVNSVAFHLWLPVQGVQKYVLFMLHMGLSQHGAPKKNGWLVISHLEMDDFGALGYLLFRKPPYHSQSHGICPLGFHLHPPRTLPPEAARQAHTIAQPNPPLFLSARLGTQEMKRNWDRNRVWMAYWCLAGNGGIGWWFIDVNSFHGYRTRHCFAVPSCLTVRDMGNCTAFPTTSTSRTVKIGSEEYILFIIIIIYIILYIYNIIWVSPELAGSMNFTNLNRNSPTKLVAPTIPIPKCWCPWKNSGSCDSRGFRCHRKFPYHLR